MSERLIALVVMLSLAVLAIGAISCVRASSTILFDGRVPIGFGPADFDTAASPYTIDGRKGAQPWAEIITTGGRLPTPASFFGPSCESFQVAITDASVYPGTPGFRRADLIPNGAGTTRGVALYYFAVQKSDDKPLDPAHQYELVSLVTPDDRRTVFDLRYGADWAGTAPGAGRGRPDTLRLHGAGTAGRPDSAAPLFEVEFVPGVFHKFVVFVDWIGATITVYYGPGDDPAGPVVGPTANRVVPGAGIQLGLLKFPRGATPDPSQGGQQGRSIDEAVIHAGIVVVDLDLSSRATDAGGAVVAPPIPIKDYALEANGEHPDCCLLRIVSLYVQLVRAILSK